MARKYYVGHMQYDQMKIVYTDKPTKEEHPDCFALTGPFKTKLAAKIMVDGGSNNPHTSTVYLCESIAANKRKGM